MVYNNFTIIIITQPSLSALSSLSVNIGFWSQCVLGKTPLYLAGKVSFRAVGKEICKINIFNPFYSLDSCNQSLNGLFSGQKREGHAQNSLLKGLNSKSTTSIPVPQEFPPGCNCNAG